MATLGQELKRERELRGISLKEVANSTKISIKLLKALEDDQWDIFPGEFFIKSVLKAHAKFIGIDENFALNKYHEMTLFQEKELSEPRKKGESKFRIPQENKILLGLVLFLVIIVLIIASFLFIPHTQKSSQPAVRAAAVIPQEQKVPPPVTAPERVQEEKKEINLGMTFLDKTWIQIYADGMLKLDGIKKRGDEIQLKAQKEFLINSGNAGGMAYTLNGKKGKPIGPSGAVVKGIKINLENIQQFLLPEEGVQTQNKRNTTQG
jgi:transcriptional regulator with XRE-family HTH domain